WRAGGRCGPCLLECFFFQAEDGIRDDLVTGVQTCALPISFQQVFQKVAPSVLAIRAQGRDAMSGSQTRIIERGSGVLISRDGLVLTAAYLVHGMDEISVEFPGGVKVSARVVTSEPAAADLALLQLERVPLGSVVSPM